MKLFLTYIIFACCVTTGWTQTLRQAGDLLVDLNADSLTNDTGTTISSWENRGTLGRSFQPLDGMSGPTLSSDLIGQNAVIFNGSENALLIGPAAPDALSQKQPWSIETWIWTPNLSTNTSVFLTWSEYPSGFWSYILMRFDKWCLGAIFSDGNVINAPNAAAPGRWHHVVQTFSRDYKMCIYVDGLLRNYRGTVDMNLEAGKPFVLGGVYSIPNAAYGDFFNGAISRLRIHSDALSEEDVYENFMTDVLSFNKANSALSMNATGSWTNSAVWQNGIIAMPPACVRISGSDLTISNTNRSDSYQMVDLADGSLTVDASYFRSLSPFTIGRGPGSVAKLKVINNGGAWTAGSDYTSPWLDMGVNGATASLEVGGDGTEANVSTWRLRTHTGESSINIQKGAILHADSFVALNNNPPTVRLADCILQNWGYDSRTSGYFFNIPSVTLAGETVTFNPAAKTTMSISANLTEETDASVGLNKIGDGTLILSGTNHYSGATHVQAGTLQLASRLQDGLVYHLDSSKEALGTLQMDSESNVLSWADYNGNFLFTTNRSEIAPVYDASLFGGRGGLRFTRNNTICRLATDKDATIQTVIIVFTPASGNNKGGLWGKNGNDYGIRLNANNIAHFGNQNDFTVRGRVYTNGVIGSGFTIGEPIVMTAISGKRETWKTAIGDYWGDPSFRRVFKGDIAEILTYNRELDDYENQALVQHLMAKWFGTTAAPLPAASPLPNGNALTVDLAGTVDLNGVSVHLSTLAGSGIVINNHTNMATLSIGSQNDSLIILNTITGNVAVAKTGTGEIALCSPTSFTGPLSVQDGKLVLAQDIDPVSVSGIAYHFDASDKSTFTFAEDGSNILSWASIDGPSYTFTTTIAEEFTAPVYDASLFNGKGGVLFGQNNKRNRMTGAVTNVQTVFIVNYITTGGNNNGGLWGKDGYDYGLRLGGNTYYWPGNKDDFHWQAQGGMIAMNGIEGTPTTLFLQPQLVTSVCGKQNTFGTAIGDYWASTQYPERHFHGAIAEILVYDRKLPDLERKAIEQKLLRKWVFNQDMDASLPDRLSVAVQSGATLDLFNREIQISTLSGGGTITNGTLVVTDTIRPNGTLHFIDSPGLNGTLSLDFTDESLERAIAVDGTLDLSQLTLQVTLPTNASGKSKTLITAQKGISGTFKEIAIPSPWRIVANETTIRLVCQKETVLILH